jgi:hypothetical protein
LLATAIFFCVSGCGQKSEAVRRFSTLNFDGYKLPGRIEQAKEMGFKDCKSGYDSFECTRTADSTLMGVKTLSATLRLEYKDYFLDNGSYEYSH